MWRAALRRFKLLRHYFRCRQAFILNRIYGLAYSQAAAAMGSSIKMVEKQISRALAACRAAACLKPVNKA
ncbi:sigma factor-like helix-turn-helix DNA-binding protein [Xanthomonas cannabis]|uniref:sigma factor-like helix-turn-helix DNA-binding protein n=1 Tax=Xanthomonas cannabis TaxID=1885674 RepID=UPI0033A8E048